MLEHEIKIAGLMLRWPFNFTKNVFKNPLTRWGLQFVPNSSKSFEKDFILIMKKLEQQQQQIIVYISLNFS